MTVRVHRFDSTGEAYDASQTRDAQAVQWAKKNWPDCDWQPIEDGDVLVVGPEQVAGVLVQAWPVAVTQLHGAFHVADSDLAQLDDGRYAESVETARGVADESGWDPQALRACPLCGSRERQGLTMGLGMVDGRQCGGCGERYYVRQQVVGECLADVEGSAMTSLDEALGKALTSRTGEPASGRAEPDACSDDRGR